MSNAPTEPLFQRLAVIGLGLIGGSLALAAKQAGLVTRVVGCARSQRSLDQGMALGVIDEGFLDAAEAVKGADLVFLSVPVGSMASIMQQIAPALAPDAVVTDGGSVKAVILQAAEAHLPDVSRFVPGHPIAGREKSGVSAALASLYVDHRVILTPTENTHSDALRKVTQLWQGVGAQVEHLDVNEHDRILAETSHLPHLLAFSLVDTLSRQGDSNRIFHYAAGGFRDFTRIASSSPVMWRDIFRHNKTALLAALSDYEQGLQQFRASLEAGRDDDVTAIMERANHARDYFMALNAQSSYEQAKQDMTTQIDTAAEQDIRFHSHGGGPLTGQVRVPGDKSISHRSIMLGALAEGCTEIDGFLEGEDALATLQTFRDLGVLIEGPDNGRVKVHGVGLHGLKPASKPLYMGNSGTSMRLLMGLLAGQSFASTLTGDASLSRRPMERIAIPLRQMQAQVDTADDGHPPVTLKGGAALKGVDYTLPMASAQVKSAVLLAGLYAEGTTSVIEPAPTRDHTERMLRGFGYEVVSNGRHISLNGGGKLTACQLEVPADISSAAFFMVAAAITPGSDILLEHVGVNPTRTGIIDILRLMGGDIALENPREAGGEPVADIRVKYAPLKGIEIPEELVPLAIDEFPVLFVAAANAQGDTVLHGARELRVKESDRIQVMADGLTRLGVSVETYDDGLKITGGAYGGGQIQALGDHRIAMSFAVAGLQASDEIVIDGCATVATSFPGFADMARRLGMQLQDKEVTP